MKAPCSTSPSTTTAQGSSGPAKPPPPPSTDTDKDKDKGAAQKGNVRGKGGKAKRASKYAEQDEEDRLLALQLLQSQGAPWL